jgi:transcriptional regulator with XRE-family HTH domain
MWAKAKPANQRTHPLVRYLFNEAIERRILDKTLSSMTGFSQSTLRTWRYGKAQPNVASVEALANALGYDLKLVRRP